MIDYPRQRRMMMEWWMRLGHATSHETRQWMSVGGGRSRLSASATPPVPLFNCCKPTQQHMRWQLSPMSISLYWLINARESWPLHTNARVIFIRFIFPFFSPALLSPSLASFFQKRRKSKRKYQIMSSRKKRHQKMRNAAFCFIKVAIFARPSVGRSVRKDAYTGFYQWIGGW